MLLTVLVISVLVAVKIALHCCGADRRNYSVNQAQKISGFHWFFPETEWCEVSGSTGAIKKVVGGVTSGLAVGAFIDDVLVDSTIVAVEHSRIA